MLDTIDPTAIDPETVRAALAAGEKENLRALLAGHHPADIAALMAELEPAEVWSLLDLMPLARQAETFGYLERDWQAELAIFAPRARLAALVTEMNADDRADMFNELSDEQREALLPALAQAEREDIRRLSAYEEGAAGSVMTSDYATLSEDLTVAQALEKLRFEAPDKETIYRSYVIDADRRLVGAVRLRDLILAPAWKTVRDIMERNAYAVNANDDQEEVAKKIGRYDVLALPVVDDEGRLVGIVTHDDAMDVLQEEATEDFHRVAAASPVMESVRAAGVFLLYRARIVWLVALVFGSFLSGGVIAAFEGTIAAYVALVMFLPVLIGSGGNAGSQAATLMVRALATGDVGMNDWGRMIGREVLIAGLLGLTMAAAVSLIGVARGGPEIALVVSSSMVLIVLVGSLIGMSLPFILTKLKLDPATASAPLVTSVADLAGVTIYLVIATSLLAPPGA